jgi:uncharacterized protein with FMN-binding domain
MPKRAIVAIAATALALVLLFSFKTPDAPGIAGSRGSSVNGVGAPIQAQTAAPRSTRAPATAAPRGTTPGATQAPAATPAPAGGKLADGTVAGPVVSTRYGPVQVQVTISGGKISDIAALQLPSDHPRSAAISDYVQPILRDEALQAQSAQIDLVSGATYTSMAYARSLQAALDQAHG